MAKRASVAPKERINVTFKPAIGDAQEEVELPLKLLVAGDFWQRDDPRPIEERKPINIDKDNFNEVLAKQNLSIELAVPNRLSEENDDELAVRLHLASLRDFSPEGIVNQVPELRQLLELREALVALKGPLGNLPAFRKVIESVLTDDASREKILKELKGETVSRESGENA